MEQTDKKISQMPPLQTVSGDEIVPVVKSGGNYSALVSQIVALARQTMVEAQAGKGLSANDFTDALKAKLEGLSSYDDTEVRSLITAINGRLDTILGDGASTAIDTFNEIEAFLTGITDTQTLTGLLQEQKQTITAETDNKLANKVDKVTGKGLSANDYTDEDKAKLGALLGNEQFGLPGMVKKANGQFLADAAYSSSDLLPLNRNYDLVFVARAYSDAASVSFYTADGTWISSIQKSTVKETILPKSEFPTNAAFVRFTAYTPEVSTCYYRNGETIESREGAASEAIQAAMTAAVDETLIAEATAAGAVFNRTSGYFELNGLTDITAKHMRTILAAGARQSSTLPWAYVSSTIRTHLPRVGIGQAANAVSTFRSCSFLETVEMPNMILQGDVFFNCNQLRSVNWKGIPIYNLNNTANANFQGCSKLVELRGCFRSNFDFNIADSPLLSLASIQYMVDYAYNTAPITVTVHPTVYGKLTDEQADIMAFLPENLLTGLSSISVSNGVTFIDNGVEVTAPKAYFRIKHSPRLVDGGIGKLTVSCDVEGLQDGESISLAVGAINSTSRPSWTISANGRSVFSFDASKYSNDSANEHSFLLYDVNSTYTGQGLKLTNFKLSYGEHDALPYTAPLSSITDDATREKAEWLSLMQIAEARGINFVTTE